MDARELKSSLATLVRDSLPEIAGALWPVRARVVRVQEAGGDESDETPRYTVDVQVLRPDGSDDEAWPEIQQVDLPQIWAGPDVGVWCEPEVGMRVRLAWEYGDRNRPYVETLLGIGGRAPEHPVGTLVVKAGDAVLSIRRSGGGELAASAATVRIKGKTKVVIESDVMVELGAEGGEALVRLSDLATALSKLTLPVSGPTAGPLLLPILPASLGGTTKVKAT
jgi:hypothetical protein